MFNVAENRKFPRMSIDCGITYRHVDTEQIREAVAKNISGNGLLFLADEKPPLGTLMEVRIQHGTLSIPSLKAIVEVVRVDAGAAGQDGGQFGVAAVIRSME